MIVFVTLAAVAFGGIGAAIALRSGSASVVQGLFPLVFVILFLSSAFFPYELMLEPAATVAEYNPVSFIVEGVRDPVISTLTGEAAWKAFASIIGIAAISLGTQLPRAAASAEDGRMTAALAIGWPTVAALVRRSANELIRVPGAAIPGVLAPTIFFVGLTSVFGNLTELRGFDTDTYASFLIPISLLQGAGFTGAATGVNLARDIEQGWFDRLLASPAPRSAILSGMVASAAIRSLVPATVLVSVALAVGRGLARAARPADRGRRRDGDGHGGSALGMLAGTAVPDAVGRPAHAGGDVRPRPVHDLLRAARPAPAVAADGV